MPKRALVQPILKFWEKSGNGFCVTSRILFLCRQNPNEHWLFSRLGLAWSTPGPTTTAGDSSTAFATALHHRPRQLPFIPPPGVLLLPIVEGRWRPQLLYQEASGTDDPGLASGLHALIIFTVTQTQAHQRTVLLVGCWTPDDAIRNAARPTFLGKGQEVPLARIGSRHDCECHSDVISNSQSKPALVAAPVRHRAWSTPGPATTAGFSPTAFTVLHHRPSTGQGNIPIINVPFIPPPGVLLLPIVEGRWRPQAKKQVAPTTPDWHLDCTLTNQATIQLSRRPTFKHKQPPQQRTAHPACSYSQLSRDAGDHMKWCRPTTPGLAFGLHAFSLLSTPGNGIRNAGSPCRQCVVSHLT